MLCNQLHKFENALSQVVTLEIWNPTFKKIGNRLHAHGNRLLPCKTIIKLFGLLVIDYCLLVIDYQRVKTLVKDFSLKNSFGQIVLFNLFFWKNLFILILMLFMKFLHILSLLLNLHLNLDSWLNDSLVLETCLTLDSWFESLASSNKLGKLCFHILRLPKGDRKWVFQKSRT